MFIGTPRKARKRHRVVSGHTPRSKRLTPKRTPVKQVCIYLLGSGYSRDMFIAFLFLFTEPLGTELFN